MSEAEDVIALAEVEDKGRALALPEPGQALAYSKQLYGDWKTFIDSAIERARRAEQDGVAKKHAAASLLKAQQTSTPAAKLLITKSHGVAHLDQAVMIDQVQKQADVIDKQKVSLFRSQPRFRRCRDVMMRTISKLQRDQECRLDTLLQWRLLSYSHSYTELRDTRSDPRRPTHACAILTRIRAKTRARIGSTSRLRR